MYIAKNDSLFTEITAAEAASVNGGFSFNNSPDSFLEATAECGFQASNLR